jgi:hypothetical protein
MSDEEKQTQPYLEYGCQGVTPRTVCLGSRTRVVGRVIYVSSAMHRRTIKENKMKTTAEMIKVMQHWEDGGKIQVRAITGWSDPISKDTGIELLWNWEYADYRIAPSEVPDEWINILNQWPDAAFKWITVSKHGIVRLWEREPYLGNKGSGYLSSGGRCQEIARIGWNDLPAGAERNCD